MKRRKKFSLSRHVAQLDGLLLIAVLISCLGSFWWLGELFSHFAIYYIFSGILLVIFSLLGKRYKWALITFLLCLWQGYKLLAFWQVPDIMDTSHANLEEVRILQYNVNRENDNVNEMAKWVVSNSEKVDIVVLFEINDRWQTAIERVKWAYPYHIAKEARGNRQIVVLSKLLMDDLEVQELADNEYGIVIRGVTLEKETPFVLYAAHATPPVLPSWMKRRDEVLKAAATHIADEEVPHKILVGDFNMTRFSPRFKEIEKISGLYDSNRGIGHMIGTWPSSVARMLALPIDNLLVSSNIKVNSKQLGPAIGSDHYPVITSLSFITPKERATKGE